MGYNLPQMARRAGKRANLTLRPIIPTKAQATDLAAILVQAATIWAENLDAILAGYDPPPLPTADALVLDTADQMQAAIDRTAGQFMTRLVTVITPALRRWAVRAEAVHRSKWVAAVKAGTGVDLATILTAQPVEEALSTWLARNVALVRNVSDVTQAKISDAVFRGYQSRTPVREVAKEIREAVGGSRARAVRIASHQSSALSGALDMERQAEAGLEFYRWRHSAKKFPRKDHLARDGKIYNLRTGKERDGVGVVLPDDRPGMAPACGCRAQAWIPILEEIEEEES